MGNLNEAIDKAVREQYPNGSTPTVLQKAARESVKTKWVTALDQQLVADGFIVRDTFPTNETVDPRKLIVREFRFHPVRMWRIDRAMPALKIGIEIDGGSFGRIVQCHQCHASVMRKLKDGRWVPVREGGRHNTGSGMEADHEKANAAIVLGWRILKFTAKHVRGHEIVPILKQLAM